MTLAIIAPDFPQAMHHVERTSSGRTYCGKRITASWHRIREVGSEAEARKASNCNQCHRALGKLSP